MQRPRQLPLSLSLPRSHARAPGLLLAASLTIASCGPDVASRNDRGVALMGRYEYAAAEAEFAAAVRRAPDWLDARINLAIATLNRQNEGDERLALDILADVLEIEPDEPRALYTSAVLHWYLGEIEPAKTLFARVAELDPDDAYAVYFLGLAHLQRGDHGAAADWLRKSAELDPHLLSAYYTGSQALRRAGRDEEAARLLEDYQRLKPNPAARLVEMAYKRMGPKAEALATAPEKTIPPPKPQGPLFAAPQALEPTGPTPGSITTADVDGDGLQDLVLTGEASPVVLAGQPESAPRFAVLADHPLGQAYPAAAALWGDIDDDGLVDVVFCGPAGTRIWRQYPRAAWSAQTVLGEEACHAGALVDADHDGDLDVLAVGPDGNELFSNNRDGSFRRLAAEMGLRGQGDGRQALVADFDGDRDLDILVVNRSPPHDIWQNDRTWEYRSLPGLDDLKQTALTAVTVADADADGHREIYGIAADGDLLRWHTDGSAWTRSTLIRGTAPAEAGELDVADFDGDGRPELLRVLPSGFSVIDAHSGAVLFEDAPSRLGSVIAATLDAGRGPELVAAHDGGLSLWPAGSGRYDYLSVSLTGRSEAEQTRSNASGIGTLVQARAAGRWTVFDHIDPHSGPGQSLQPLSIGLGGRPRADFIALEWTDGVSQTELDLAAREHHVIAEKQRQLASCPVLFAWNGHKFEFVSDVLGGAALGYLEAPGEYAPPRPVEGFLLDSTSLAVRDGRYALKLAEPMEENAYLDAARLTVYELPPGWNIVLDERLAVGGAPATGRHITYRRATLPTLVRATDGTDVTALALRRDHRAPPPGVVDHRFIGLLAEEQVLTLEFAAPLAREGAVLVADGWIEYPYSQTVFAAWQAGLRYRPPTLEARSGDGDWQPVVVEFGYPAGMPRTMALPLPNLPPGTDALRLTSNMEIYWDRLRVVWEEPLDGVVKATLAPVDARIARTGFAKRTTGPQRLPHYDYAKRSPYQDAKAPGGFYTAFGDGGELVRDVDGALAIISSGEEIHLEFDALPEPPPGQRRFFRIEFHGWAKDMDLYTRHGDTVGPLPVPAGADEKLLARRDRLHERYNVRYREGL